MADHCEIMLERAGRRREMLKNTLPAPFHSIVASDPKILKSQYTVLIKLICPLYSKRVVEGTLESDFLVVGQPLNE